MNETNQPPETGRDSADRSVAAFAHAAAVLAPLTNYVGGVIIALVIYVVYRERSDFVRAQALQALVFQLLSLLLTIGAWLAWGFLYMLSLVPLMVGPETDAVPWTLWLGLGSMVLPCGLMLVLLLIPLWAAWQVYQGRDFRYPLFGDWIAERF